MNRSNAQMFLFIISLHNNCIKNAAIKANFNFKIEICFFQKTKKS